jgi:hypothetical protein
MQVDREQRNAISDPSSKVERSILSVVSESVIAIPYNRSFTAVCFNRNKRNLGCGTIYNFSVVSIYAFILKRFQAELPSVV